MTLLILAYLGGALTILSPCILPVLPFVLGSAGQPFLRGRLPMLAGMALTFAAVATLASAGGAWAVRLNEYGRTAALILLAIFGLSLLVPTLANVLARPLVALGNRLAASGWISPSSSEGTSAWRSLILGVATGMLWAPCAGPILGLVLTAAALEGASVSASLALLAYATGAATSLAVALGIGGRALTVMKRSMGASEWLRRGLGAGVLGGVIAIGLGADTGLLARLSASGPVRIEQALIDALRKPPPKPQAANDAGLGAGMLRLNEWGLSGNWTVGPEQATLNRGDGGITYRFHARDLHLVLGPAADGRAVRFVVTVDGKPPGASHGADIDAAGNGAVTQTRLYQLVRQAGEVGERTFMIRFLDPGAQAHALTFG